MFRGVLGDQLQPIQAPNQKNNPFHKQKISNQAKNNTLKKIKKIKKKKFVKTCKDVQLD
jgi:hypothetical protein